MPKTTGLGQKIYVGGYDLSGDVGSIQAARGGNSPLIVTGLDQSAEHRVAGLRDGNIDFSAWYNPTAAQAHPVLSALPTANTQVLYAESSVIGGQAACLTGKQVGYAGARGQDGSLAFTVSAMADGAGLEWGELLTAGLRTDTTPTNGASVDHGAVSTLFGLSAYLQVTALTGTNVVVTLQDSADNVTFAAITGAAFTSVTAARTTERIQTATGATIRRYVRAVTSGTFTSATFVCAFTRHLTSTL